MRAVLCRTPSGARVYAAFQEVATICDEDAATNESIGKHGLEVLRMSGIARAGRIGSTC